MKIKQIVTLVRWLVSAALFYTAYRRVMGGAPVVDVETEMEVYQTVGIPSILSGVAFLMGGVAFIAPELIEWGSIPFRIFFNSVFFPGTRETPPPDYNLSLLYREQGRYAEALEAYLKLLKNHPQELLAYIEGIQTSFECGDEESARKFLRMGLRDLTAPEAREHVQRIFDTCLTAPPSLPEDEETVAVEEPFPPRSES